VVFVGKIFGYLENMSGRTSVSATLTYVTTKLDLSNVRSQALLMNSKANFQTHLVKSKSVPKTWHQTRFTMDETSMLLRVYPSMIQICSLKEKFSPKGCDDQDLEIELDSSSLQVPLVPAPLLSTLVCVNNTKINTDSISIPTSLAAATLRRKTVEAIRDGSQLSLTSDGCGGAYMIRTSAKKNSPHFAVFKPRDEEFMAPHNPRGYVKEDAIVGMTPHPVRKGFVVGNGAIREVAAYLLDEAYDNFSGVPVTSLVNLPVNSVSKEGSVQQFVASESSAEDMGTLNFSINEVHKIGILDVRMFNTDRHAGNILLTSKDSDGKYKMTPIDHGLALPSWKHLDGACFDWLNWSQAKFPFSPESMNHIASLNEIKDAAILRSIGVEEDCITTMMLSTVLLKKGAAAGYSLFDIADNLQRPDFGSDESVFEIMVAKAAKCVIAEKRIDADTHKQAFGLALLEKVSNAIDDLFDDQPKSKVRSFSNY